MDESSQPHRHIEKTDNITPIEDDRLDPNELERHELLEQFLSQCGHPSLPGGEQVSTFIVSTLRSSPDEPWGYLLQDLKVDVFGFGEQYFDDMREQDAIFARIYELIIETKDRVARGESMSMTRKALLELLDLRAGVAAQFDRSQLMNERNETKWSKVLDKVISE
jgi:hypothetical protein